MAAPFSPKGDVLYSSPQKERRGYLQWSYFGAARRRAVALRIYSARRLRRRTKFPPAYLLQEINAGFEPMSNPGAGPTAAENGWVEREGKALFTLRC